MRRAVEYFHLDMDGEVPAEVDITAFMRDRPWRTRTPPERDTGAASAQDAPDDQDQVIDLHIQFVDRFP